MLARRRPRPVRGHASPRSSAHRAAARPPCCGWSPGSRPPTPERSPSPDDRSPGPAGPSPPHRRDVGYVAQDGALFPHLTVGQNIAYGLRGQRARRPAPGSPNCSKPSRSTSPTRRADPTSCPAASSSASRWPGRSPASPALMLLDEPFSALDTGLRASTRKAVAELLADAGVTTLLVTHDQEEALSIADQVAVMRDGRFTKVGTPQQVYLQPERPVHRRVPRRLRAAAVHGHRGVGRLRARPHSGARPTPPTGPATLMLRPEQLVATAVSDDGSARRSAPCSRRSSADTTSCSPSIPAATPHRSSSASTASIRRRSTPRCVWT